MIKQMVAITRRPDMTHAEYVHHIKYIHGYQIAASHPLTIRKYIQNYVYDSAYGTREDMQSGSYKIIYSRDSVTELYFDSLESMTETFSDPYSRDVVAPDGPNFDDGRNIPLLVEEQELPVPCPTDGGSKIFYYIKKSDTISTDDFRKLWHESHHEIMEQEPAIAKQLYKCIENVPLSFGRTDHFRTTDILTYETVVTMWFADTDVFRDYQRSIRKISKRKGDFIDESKSFCLFVEPCLIFEAE